MTKGKETKHWTAIGWLLFATLIWGASFPLVKMVLHSMSPFLLMLLRFSLAAVLLFALFPVRKIQIDEIKRGGLLGVFMFLGMAFQTLGLQQTTATKSGFLTGLSVVFVPLLVVFLEKKVPSPQALVAVFLSVVGLYLLMRPEASAFNRGDGWTLLCAIAFACQIVGVEMFAKKGDTLILTGLMIVTTALLALITLCFFETPHLRYDAVGIAALAFIILFCTVIAFQIQLRWQPQIHATTAAVVYAMEPVFATLFAFLVLRERLNPISAIGAGLIFAAMIISESNKQRRDG